MTSNDSGLRARLQHLIPAVYREFGYRLSSAVTLGLLAFGILDSNAAALWAQFGVGLVTLLFALLYSTDSVRTAIYAFTGVGGSVLLYYGLVSDVRWALITAAIAQAFGITTAAAKTVTVDSAGYRDSAA